jgi:hypothetical protein
VKAASASATQLLSARRSAMIDRSGNRSSRRPELSSQAKASRGCGISLTPSTSWANPSTIGRCKTVPTAQLLLALRQGSHPPGPGTHPTVPAHRRRRSHHDQHHRSVRRPAQRLPRDAPNRAQPGAAQALTERDDLCEPHHPAADTRARTASEWLPLQLDGSCAEDAEPEKSLLVRPQSGCPDQ